jgi:hypothetical protein
MKYSHFNTLVTLVGVSGFFIIIVYLQSTQVEYSPIHQLMSELVFGKNGHILIWAFISFAMAVFGAIMILISFNAHLIINILMGLASLSLASAGVFTLKNAEMIHIGFIAIALFAMVLSLYLIPRLILAFRTPMAIATCWGCGVGIIIFVGLGHEVLSFGIAQRLTAACVLLWLSWLSIINLKLKDE